MDDPQLDIELFKRTSVLSNNDPNAKAWLGRLYYCGRGTQRNLEIGKTLMQQAAESGVKWAKEELNSYK